MGEKGDYIPANQEDEERLLVDGSQAGPVLFSATQVTALRSTWARRLWASVGLNALLALVAVLSWVQSARQSETLHDRHEIFTPASSAIEYEQVVFIAGTQAQRSPYQGSTKEIDELWENLYNEFGISLIPTEAAAQLPNATMPLSQDPSNYVVQLDVFHQLHCLNLMRKLVYPQKYEMDTTSGSDEALENLDHLEHCYDQLRQSLQCHSDLATIYWEWVPEEKRAYGNLATTHTCKNFDKVKEWAHEHNLHGDFDMEAEVEGAPIRHLSDWGEGVKAIKDHVHGDHHGS